MTGPAPSELGDDPYAVTNIAFSADTRVLAVTGNTGQVERRITASRHLRVAENCHKSLVEV